jgi:hypothetical protein
VRPASPCCPCFQERLLLLLRTTPLEVLPQVLPQVLPSALSPALPSALPSAPMYFPMQSVLAPKAPKHLRLRSVLVLATAKKHAMQQHLALRLRAAAMLEAVLRCRVYLVALS